MEVRVFRFGWCQKIGLAETIFCLNDADKMSVRLPGQELFV